MAGDDTRARAIEAAKERARQRILEQQQAEQSRVTGTSAADKDARKAELTANEQMAADQRLAEAGRSPAVGANFEQPGLGIGSAGNETADNAESRRAGEATDPGKASDFIRERFGAQGAALEGELASRVTDTSPGLSPETEAALDVFDRMTSGNAPGALDPETQAASLARPGLSGSGQGFGSGMPGGGVAQGSGREGAGYGMNEVFTQQAMQAAARGDTAALDRLAKQVREHYGRPDPGSTRSTGGQSSSNGESSEGAGVGYSGAAGFSESEGVQSHVGTDWAEEFPTLAKIAKIFSGESSVAGATANSKNDAGQPLLPAGQALQQAVNEMEANAHPSSEQPVDSEELTTEQKAELAAWFAKTTGVDPRTGGRIGAGGGDGRTDPADYTTPETGGNTGDARDRLRGGDDELAGGAPEGAIAYDEFDVEHSQDELINYGPGGSAGAGQGQYLDTPDTERKSGFNYTIPGDDDDGSGLLQKYAASSDEMSSSSREAAASRFSFFDGDDSGDGA